MQKTPNSEANKEIFRLYEFFRVFATFTEPSKMNLHKPEKSSQRPQKLLKSILILSFRLFLGFLSGHIFHIFPTKIRTLQMKHVCGAAVAG